MPTVATYQPDQARTQVAGPTRASTVQNGLGNLAQGINEVAKLSNQMSQEASLASAQEAVTQFEREKNDMFFNPESGYFNTQGRNAVDGAKGISESLEKLRQKYATGLDGVAQREFDRVASAQITRSGADIMRHSSKNLQAWKQANMEAEVENTLENAALYSNNLKQLDIQRVKGRQSVIESAQMQGLSADATNEKLQNYDTAFAMNIIKTETLKSADAGEKAMELWGKNLEGPDLVNMRDALKTKSEVEKDESLASESIARAGRLVKDYGDNLNAREQALEEINKIEDEELRKRTMTEFNYQFGQKQQADAETRVEVQRAAEDFMYEGGSIEEFKRQNGIAWNRLTATQKAQLETRGPVQTNWVEHTEAMTMTDAQLKALKDPHKYSTTLAKTEYKEFFDRWLSVNKGTESNTAGQTRANIRKSALTVLYGNTAGRVMKSNEPKAQAFLRAVDAEATRIEEQTGKEMTSVEYSDMVNNLTRLTYMDKGFFGKRQESIDDLSAEELRTVSEILENGNLPFNQNNIQTAIEDARRIIQERANNGR